MKKLKIILGGFALLAALGFALYGGWLWHTQDSVIFQPARAQLRHIDSREVPTGYEPDALQCPLCATRHPAQNLTLEVDGAVLSGARFVGPKTGPTVLMFGGSAADDVRMAYDLGRWTGYTTTGYNYRGYGYSTGRPSQDALYADALRVFDSEAKEGRPIVVAGYSLGASVAAWVAANRTTAGLVLVAPSDSLKRSASDRYPWLPVASLLRHPFPTVEFIGKVEEKVAVIRAGQDKNVLPASTDRLQAAIPHLVKVVNFPQASHSLSAEKDYPAALTAAIEEVSR